MLGGRKAAALSQRTVAAQRWAVMSKPRGGRWGTCNSTHPHPYRGMLTPSIRTILLHATKAQELGSAFMQLGVELEYNSSQLLLRDACIVHLQNNSIQGNRALISLENLCATVVKSASGRPLIKALNFPIQIPLPCFYAAYTKSHVNRWQVSTLTKDLVKLPSFPSAGDLFSSVAALFATTHFRHQQKNHTTYSKYNCLALRYRELRVCRNTLRMGRTRAAQQAAASIPTAGSIQGCSEISRSLPPRMMLQTPGGSSMHSPILTPPTHQLPTQGKKRGGFV